MCLFLLVWCMFLNSTLGATINAMHINVTMELFQKFRRCVASTNLSLKEEWYVIVSSPSTCMSGRPTYMLLQRRLIKPTLPLFATSSICTFLGWVVTLCHDFLRCPLTTDDRVVAFFGFDVSSTGLPDWCVSPTCPRIPDEHRVLFLVVIRIRWIGPSTHPSDRPWLMPNPRVGPLEHPISHGRREIPWLVVTDVSFGSWAGTTVTGSIQVEEGQSHTGGSRSDT